MKSHERFIYHTGKKPQFKSPMDEYRVEMVTPPSTMKTLSSFLGRYKKAHPRTNKIPSQPVVFTSMLTGPITQRHLSEDW